MLINDTLNTRFFTPLLEAAPSGRNCPKLSDSKFLVAGITRVLSRHESGRSYLQQHISDEDPIVRGTYFDSIASKRRLVMTCATEIALSENVVNELRRHDDRLECIPELEGREVWAGDGHVIEHACHDARFACSDGTLRYRGVNTIYLRDLRSGAVRVLDLCLGSEHEVKVLQRQNIAALKAVGGKGAILAFDSASVDFGLWHRWRQGSGIYVISRWKSNLAPLSVKSMEWDRDDVRNAGIISDEQVVIKGHGKFRRVTFCDSETESIHVFVTSDMKLPPGIVALIYRLRWDIEKVFDEFENKLGENKAWACSDVAKRMQCLFIAMTHNLMLLLQCRLAKEEGIVDAKLDRKHDKAMKRRESKCAESGTHINAWVIIFRRATQCSLQFIRWIRYHLDCRTSYRESIAALAPLMEKYI